MEEIEQRSGKVVHTAMVCFTALHNTDSVTQEDLDKFCENKTNMCGIKDKLTDELNTIYSHLSP